MKSNKRGLLAINSGSSSIKFAFYNYSRSLKLLLKGEVERIGMKNAQLQVTHSHSAKIIRISLPSGDQEEVINFLMDWLKKQNDFDSVKWIGHRIVHGMKHSAPERITAALLDELRQIIPFDPEHLPVEIKLVEAFGKKFPSLLQIACFDTSFHSNMPPVAKLLPIPRRYRAMGIKRYGFHGLSFAYLMEELIRIAGKKKAKGKIILAHLGNGASLAALKDGKSLDTSMGFTPSSGLIMGTRTGDLDPGVAWYLMQKGKLSPGQFSDLINHQSGLLGISETSSDMRELKKCQGTDPRAAEAIELFCYQTKKWIGSFMAVLGGLDTLIFSGGIGAHDPEARTQICQGLQSFGIVLDENRNQGNEAVISAEQSPVCIRVISTNEELMIARMVGQVIGDPIKS
ncbi:MAG: acetate/propionate family kinase [Chitinophagaceae bacterium]